MDVNDQYSIPASIITSLARAVAPAILEYFESEVGQAEYAKENRRNEEVRQTECA